MTDMLNVKEGIVSRKNDCSDKKGMSLNEQVEALESERIQTKKLIQELKVRLHCSKNDLFNLNRKFDCVDGALMCLREENKRLKIANLRLQSALDNLTPGLGKVRTQDDYDSSEEISSVKLRSKSRSDKSIKYITDEKHGHNGHLDEIHVLDEKNEPPPSELNNYNNLYLKSSLSEAEEIRFSKESLYTFKEQNIAGQDELNASRSSMSKISSCRKAEKEGKSSRESSASDLKPQASSVNLKSTHSELFTQSTFSLHKKKSASWLKKTVLRRS